MKEIWLNIDAKVQIDSYNRRKIYLINPELLKEKSAREIWEKIPNTFGKMEFEEWVAEMIMAISMEAIANGYEEVDFSPILGANLIIGDGDIPARWRVLMTSYNFVIAFMNLPIFNVLYSGEDKVLLEFVE